jgi:hypothetical protein
MIIQKKETVSGYLTAEEAKTVRLVAELRGIKTSPWITETILNRLRAEGHLDENQAQYNAMIQALIRAKERVGFLKVTKALKFIN